MIKENELRIGNLVMDFEDSQKYHPIECIYLNMHDKYWVSYRDNSIKCSVESLEPIPLTEEWLIKFGFEKQMMWTYAINIFGNKKLIYYLGEKGWSVGNKNYSDFSNLNYLHQLQNLYFALTGEELKLDHNEVR
jgi:hypothetical protein